MIQLGNDLNQKIMKTEIIKIESGTIECPVVDDQRYVAIKPVCEILGVSYPAQTEVLKNHPVFSSTVRLIETVGGDEKQREMLCISLKRFLGWIFTIHPNKIKEENRENLIKYQTLICDVLYEKFVEEPEFYKMKTERENQILEQLAEIDTTKGELKKKLRMVKGATWEDFKSNNRQLQIPFGN